MKEFYKLTEYDLNIKVGGWLKEFLVIMKKGLTGNIESAGEPFISFNWDKWDQEILDKTDDFWKWVPFEQTAYYLDGLTKLSTYLNDKELKEKTSKIIYSVIDNADTDSYLGPKFLKEAGKTNRWPHAVFFRAVIAKYYDNYDIKLIEALEKHFLNNKVDYRYGRNICNIEAMLLVYDITKNKELLDLAILSYINYHNDINKDATYCSHYTLASEQLNNVKPYEHGVTYNEICKLGAVLYNYTGNKEFLKPSIKAYKKIEKYHLLPDYCNSSNEFLRGNNPRETHETCDVVDFSWSLGYLLKSTKDGHYADLIEKCTYNAGIGSVLEDFSALEYFSGVNQVVADLNSNPNYYRRGSNWMSYRPGHETQCCSGNVNRFFPNFISRMWMRNNKDLFAVFYGESEVTYKSLKIIENTNYPFDDTINFSFKGRRKSFNLGLRIPKYSKNYKIYINNELRSFENKKGFVLIKGLNINDKVTLKLDSNIIVKKYKNIGVYLEKGPLVYSFGMKGNRFSYIDNICADIKRPCYNMYPDKKWNYALSDNPNPKFIVNENDKYPWDITNVPYSIEVDAKIDKTFNFIIKKEVKTTNSEYKTEWHKLKGDFIFTPNIELAKGEYEETERIILYPYGVSKLRLTVFPKQKNKVEN